MLSSTDEGQSMLDRAQVRSSVRPQKHTLSTYLHPDDFILEMEHIITLDYTIAHIELDT